MMINRRGFVAGLVGAGLGMALPITFPAIVSQPTSFDRLLEPLSPLQRDWVSCRARFASMFKDRQAGASTATAALATWLAGCGESVSIMTFGKSQADQMIEYVAKCADRMSQSYKMRHGHIRFNHAFVIVAPSYARFNSVSSHMIMEEFHLFQDRKFAFETAMGVIAGTYPGAGGAQIPHMLRVVNPLGDHDHPRRRETRNYRRSDNSMLGRIVEFQNDWVTLS